MNELPYVGLAGVLDENNPYGLNPYNTYNTGSFNIYNSGNNFKSGFGGSSFGTPSNKIDKFINEYIKPIVGVAADTAQTIAAIHSMFTGRPVVVADALGNQQKIQVGLDRAEQVKKEAEANGITMEQLLAYLTTNQQKPDNGSKYWLYIGIPVGVLLLGTVAFLAFKK